MPLGTWPFSGMVTAAPPVPVHTRFPLSTDVVGRVQPLGSVGFTERACQYNKAVSSRADMMMCSELGYTRTQHHLGE